MNGTSVANQCNHQVLRITNGLVFSTSQITFKRLIINEYVACDMMLRHIG